MDQKTHPDITELDMFRDASAPEDICEHIRNCADCQQEIALLEQVENELAVDIDSNPEIDPSVDDAMMSFIGERSKEIRQQNASRRFSRTIKIIMGSAAVLIVISSLTGPAVFKRVNDDRPTVRASKRMMEVKPMADSMKVSMEATAEPEPDINNDGVVNIIDAYMLAKQSGNDNSRQVREILNNCVALR